jgi:two-component system phosphate regulon sensor histidine kinase PhoR
MNRPRWQAAAHEVAADLGRTGDDVPMAENAPRRTESPAEAVRSFADALPEPCILLDGRGVVVHCNAVAARHFPGVAVGRPLAFSLRFPALLGAVEAARHAGAQIVELHQTVPTETWYRVTVTPMAPAAATAPDLLVMTFQSLTEEKRIEQLRRDFIANASHELRTPLTSLVGFIDTLLGPAAEDAAARRRFLTLMRGQAARMSKLIDDLLSLSRIEMHQHLRPTSDVDLNVLVREVAEGLAPLAREGGTSLAVSVPEEAILVAGDRDQLYEVIENLVENAVKYGADGGRPIELGLSRPTGRQGFAAALTVTDHGAGVAAEHVPRLTERFYRVDAESSRRRKGTGLGLAIVKHIVTRHHGLLSIRSQPGQGTRVEVLLRR